MIKKWKLFLEAKDPFEGDPFREDIINNINDMLVELKDNGFRIDTEYGITNYGLIDNCLTIKVFGKSFPLRNDGIEPMVITSDDFKNILRVNYYLISEGFLPISTNINKTADVMYKTTNSGKTFTSSLERFTFNLEANNPIKPILLIVKYQLPLEKNKHWK